MKNSKLKLNTDKTEFLIIGTKSQRDESQCFFPTPIPYQNLTPTSSARNLKIPIDKQLIFLSADFSIVQFFYHIRDLRRQYVPLSVAKTIATSLVSSRLEYCNSLCHNIALKDIMKLQRVHNCLSRVVTKSPRFSHSTPLLKSLHWLPIRHRTIFKICTITYEALSSGQPAYLFATHPHKKG